MAEMRRNTGAIKKSSVKGVFNSDKENIYPKNKTIKEIVKGNYKDAPEINQAYLSWNLDDNRQIYNSKPTPFYVHCDNAKVKNELQNTKVPKSSVNKRRSENIQKKSKTSAVSIPHTPYNNSGVVGNKVLIKVKESDKEKQLTVKNPQLTSLGSSVKRSLIPVLKTSVKRKIDSENSHVIKSRIETNRRSSSVQKPLIPTLRRTYKREACFENLSVTRNNIKPIRARSVSGDRNINTKHMQQSLRSASSMISLNKTEQCTYSPLVINKNISEKATKTGVIRSSENSNNEIMMNQETTPFLPELHVLFHMEYSEEMLEIELEKQANSPVLSKNFLMKNINNEQRKIIVSFLMRLTAHKNVPSFILFQAVKLFDAVIDITVIEIEELQIAALASLWICLKREESFHKIPTAKEIISYAKDLYKDREDMLLKWECIILKNLRFQVSFADPYSLIVYFLTTYFKYMKSINFKLGRIYYCAGYIIDVSLLDEKISKTPPCILALVTANIIFRFCLNSMNFMKTPYWLYWTALILNESDGLSSTFKDTFHLMYTLFVNIHYSKNKGTVYETVFKKYKHHRYGAVSEWFTQKIFSVPWKEIINLT